MTLSEIRDELLEVAVVAKNTSREARLDEANKLDPAGETQERVQRMRKMVDDAARATPVPDTKGRRP